MGMKKVIGLLAFLLLISLVGNAYLYRKQYTTIADLEEVTEDRNDLLSRIEQAKPIIEELGLYLDTEAKIDGCLEFAENDRIEGWNRVCELNGKEPECGLSEAQAKFMREKYESDRKLCLERYR